MEIDSIGLYLKDIGKVPLLTAQDERELAQIIETGREAQECVGAKVRQTEDVLSQYMDGRFDDDSGIIGTIGENQASLDAYNEEKSTDVRENFASILGSLAAETVSEGLGLHYEKYPPPALYRPTAAERRAISQGAEAKDRFITSNLRLVVNIARRYPLPQGMETLDLIQEGNLGLEHAVDLYDWRRGFKFSTYATFWIRQAIGRALDQKGSLIRIPGDRSAALRAALRSNTQKGEALTPEIEELKRLTTPVSLNKTVNDGDAEMGDLMSNGDPGPEESLMVLVELGLLDELLGTLDARSRFAVESRFGIIDGERRSLKEVGDSLGVTGEAVRRTVSRVVASLREEAERILDPPA